MKERIKKYFKEIIVFAISLIIITNVVGYYKATDLNKKNLEISSFNLLDNLEYKVDRSKPILLYFWASWCPTCKFTSPNIEQLSKDYEVITIAVQSGTNEEIKNYLDEYNLVFNVVNDQDSYYTKKFNIKAFPTTIIYDKNLNFKFSDVGYISTAGLYTRMFLSK